MGCGKGNPRCERIRGCQACIVGSQADGRPPRQVRVRKDGLSSGRPPPARPPDLDACTCAEQAGDASAPKVYGVIRQHVEELRNVLGVVGDGGLVRPRRRRRPRRRFHAFSAKVVRRAAFRGQRRCSALEGRLMGPAQDRAVTGRCKQRCIPPRLDYVRTMKSHAGFGCLGYFRKGSEFVSFPGAVRFTVKSSQLTMG